MSTEIAEITGRYESGVSSPFKPIYDESVLYVTRFYGGKKNGRMIQLTIQGDKTAYIQLTKQQVAMLSEVLRNCFNDEIHPSE